MSRYNKIRCCEVIKDRVLYSNVGRGNVNSASEMNGGDVALDLERSQEIFTPLQQYGDTRFALTNTQFQNSKDSF